MKINAVKFMYVKLSYKFLTSKYKKSNGNINISRISDLSLDIICVSHEKTMTLFQINPTINKFIKPTSDSKLRECYDNIIIKEK